MNCLTMRPLMLLVLTTTIFALASCGGGVPINPGSGALNQTEQAMLDRHNAHRAGLGLGVLASDTQLNQIAQDQANFQAEHLNVGHADENGGDVSDRAAAVGYLFQNIGENVGSANGGVQMFEDWLESTGHREIIEGAQYTEIGLGVTTVVGTQYWCVVFARPQ